MSSAEQVSEESSSTNEKLHRRRSSKYFKQLSVQSVEGDGTVECQLLCKQKTISFKFNRLDTSPLDIIEGMVKQELLRPGSHESLAAQLRDIFKQLEENPLRIPHIQKVGHFNLFSSKTSLTIFISLYMLLLNIRCVMLLSRGIHTQKRLIEGIDL